MIGRRSPDLLLRAVLVLLAFAMSATRAAAAPALHVIPFPGTPDASPLSPVIFSSLKPSDLKSVTVIGSSSGTHPGHSVALPDGAGTAFRPEHPFSTGEHVSVMALLNSPAAGTASGDPGSTTLRFSFTVATPATISQTSRISRAHWLGQLAPPTASPTQSFHSAPSLHPPIVSTTSDPDLTSGDIFLTEFTPRPRPVIQNGLMILDRRGRLVWFRPLDGWGVNLEAQRYHGRPVLTWFQQTFDSNGGNQDVILNRSYHTVAELRAANGYRADMHEFQLTSRGTALIDAYSRVRADLSSVGGSSSGAALDCVIQELDVKTDQVLWEWHSLGHVPVSASYSGQPSGSGWPPYDYFHLNSIQELPNDNLLISARNTWAAYEIDKQTGRVIWTLGGRYTSFRMGPGTNFEWQHDARLAGNGLSLFDDGALPQEERQSSAKVLRLDPRNMTASLVHRYEHSPPAQTGVEGSTQVLSNHDVFVGWGKQPLFSEYAPAGRQIFAGSLPLGTNSYRAYRFPWNGAPTTRPALALSSESGGTVKVYVSWNGATQVAAWRVRGGTRRGALRTLSTAQRTGFETAIVLSQPPRYLAVQALNDHGRVIGTSGVRKA